MSKRVPVFHLCRWSPWSDPVPTYSGGHKQQWRACVVCNRATFRTLMWDKQIGAAAVLAALKSVKPTEQKGSAS